MPLWFVGLIALVSFVAGATSSIVGFGIGSLLTPIMAARFGTDIAVAAIALPHLSGGLLRGWRLRQHLDRRVLVRFGILSAIGGLIGALLFASLAPTALGRVATSTVIGVMIDVVRMPVYIYSVGGELVPIWPLVAMAVVGVLAGTLVGERLLLGLSRERFRQIVSIAIGVLGLWFLFRPA